MNNQSFCINAPHLSGARHPAICSPEFKVCAILKSQYAIRKREFYVVDLGNTAAQVNNKISLSEFIIIDLPEAEFWLIGCHFTINGFYRETFHYIYWVESPNSAELPCVSSTAWQGLNDLEPAQLAGAGDLLRLESFKKLYKLANSCII
jgi:hypothetical protein